MRTAVQDFESIHEQLDLIEVTPPVVHAAGDLSLLQAAQALGIATSNLEDPA